MSAGAPWPYPPHVLPVLAEHNERLAGKDRVFVGRSRKPMRGDALRQAFTPSRVASNKEIAAALSELAGHGDSAKLPRTIVIKH